MLEKDQSVWRSAVAGTLWLALLGSAICFFAMGVDPPGSKSSFVGFCMQLIGTVYWTDRVRRKQAWIGGFRVRDESSVVERFAFGSICVALVIVGLWMAIDKLLKTNF